MLFNRRTKPKMQDRLGGLLWPRGGWGRMFKYIWFRIIRLDASAHSLAVGLALGVAISFTPFLGLHIITASLLCLFFRGHIVAAALATLVGNPWTFPFFFLLSAQVGSLILQRSVDPRVPTWSWSALFDGPIEYLMKFYSVFELLIIGSIPTAIVIALAIYFPTRKMLQKHKDRRQELLTRGEQNDT